MQRSSERILTTHAGSLARPDALRELLAARDERRPYDAAAFAASVRSAVAEVVRGQAAEAGFLLQIDDPDLADAWQIHPQMSVAEYRKFATLRIEALNHALRDIASERGASTSAGAAIMARTSTTCRSASSWI